MDQQQGATTDGNAIMRDKRAQGIAAMGLVTRECDRFSVATPSLRGRTVKYEVWRDEAGRVRCSCLEYEEHASEDATFRCEHILAVKHALVAKNSEAVVRPRQEEQTATASAGPPGSPEPADSSGKRAARKGRKVQAALERSGGEQIDPAETTAPIEAVPPASHVLSLSKQTDSEEQEMDNNENRMSIAQGSDNTGPELALSPELCTPASPLAFTNTLRALRHKVDPAVVKSRRAWTDHEGEARIEEYVEWYTVADILDRKVPDWSYAVRNVAMVGDTVAVTAAITIQGVTREGLGTSTARNALGIKLAEHDALTRAAVKFGIAREMEEREFELIEKERTVSEGDCLTDPFARSMADLVTPRQLGMIRALARMAGVDVEEECQTVYRCKTDELSKRAASSIIGHLKSLQHVAATGMRRAS